MKSYRGSSFQDYKCSEWFAAVVGFQVNSSASDRRKWDGLHVYVGPSDSNDIENSYWAVRILIDDGHDGISVQNVDLLYIRKELFD